MSTSKDVKLQVRTADQTRRAELELDRDKSAGELMQSAIDHWTLTRDTEYTLVNITTGKLIPADAQLTQDWVADGDLVEVQPVLVAG
jgi:hypothetical protein